MPKPDILDEARAQNAANPNHDLIQAGVNKAAGWAFRNYVAGALVNWKTSLAGLAAILTGMAGLVNYLSEAAQSGNFDLQHVMQLVGVIAAGVGMLSARDADKTSADQPTIPKALPVDE